MKTSTIAIILLTATMGFSGQAMANCADDAVNTCNNKHPDPNKSNQAYELYELCIKAQLGQKCPSNSGAHLSGPSNLTSPNEPASPPRVRRASSQEPTTPSYRR